ncbi:hypothetical protein M409DRAFT_63625 [Zasmidium cellare ATCC 36951]|uniref:Major facilitator superfamily (MFS) profile domain-containing protein n=1 Tax=Zasmidium cellare ATCC 36951 TaxID=1080233 RepID=A0A6A6D0V4_ZASCE|nr:uncharacterized protein M409DRAFT_63625 [Zasmidium cellare ATCC 36951]KAF2171276.1 hypothetical protein M409DRAFT_63625 [Zasmidium cellare ATCC 36951]
MSRLRTLFRRTEDADKLGRSSNVNGDASVPAAEQSVPATSTQGQDAGEEARDGASKEYDGEQEESTTEDDSKYLKGPQLLLLTTGLLLATFVVALDNTIIATAIPKITSIFDSLDDVGWYGSAYLLTTTSLQPSFGKIYTYFDVKWVYLSALMIFELGSILCAAATNSTMLIVGRAVAGAGAAALFSGAMTIIGYSVPLRRRALYIALLSSMFGISSVVGPILGGAFTDKISWRWCFWINLPFGAVSIAVVFFFFTNPPRRYTNMTVKEKIKQIDIAGAFLLICAIVCLLLALQWGGSKYAWSDSKVWGCLLGFGLIIVCFVALQFYLGDRATMPPRVLGKQRTVGACALFSAFLAMALYAHIYYLPFYFQAVKGVGAEASGIRTIPYLVSITLSSIVVGAAITIIGPYNPPMWIGSVIFVIGCGMLYTLKVNSSTGTWIGYQILAGVGAGACVQIPFIAVQVVLPEKDMPVGNAVAIFFNTLGGAIAVSIAQNIFTNTLIKQLPILAPGVDVAKVVSYGASHVREAAPPNLLPGVLEAYDRAITTAFIMPIAVSGLAFLASLMMEWKSVKGKKLMPGGA